MFKKNFKIFRSRKFFSSIINKYIIVKVTFKYIIRLLRILIMDE